MACFCVACSNLCLDFEQQRIKQTIALSGNGTSAYTSGSTWYLNGGGGQELNYEKEIKDSGVTEHRHFMNAGGISFAIAVKRSGTGVTTRSTGKLAAAATQYLHQDHLGSIAVISNELGAVLERLAYDPWGKRRFANGLIDQLDTLVGQNTDRGYTEHEHLDEVGAIHMNGRIYDPLIGRMMSADIMVPDAGNLQAYNRYSYVINNPLSFTDPSGFCFFCDPIRELAKTAKKLSDAFSTQDMQNAGKVVVIAVATYYTGGVVAGWMGYGSMAAAITVPGATFTSALAVGAASGFAAGYVGAHLYGANGQQAWHAGLRGAGAGAGMALGGYYTAGLNPVAGVVIRAGVSGRISEMQGGSFNDAFRASLLTGAAAAGYKAYVGWEASPMSGEDQEPGKNDFRYENGKIPADWENKNVIGLNQPLGVEGESDFWKQSGPMSRALNLIPGINATGQYHDTIFHPGGPDFNWLNNVLTMLPAAAISYLAIYDKVPQADSRRCPGCYR
jgi:RHS repeat-associated protein